MSIINLNPKRTYSEDAYTEKSRAASEWENDARTLAEMSLTHRILFLVLGFSHANWLIYGKLGVKKGGSDG